MKQGVKAEKGEKINWFSGPFSALLLVNFTGALGFSIVMPFLVFLVYKWGGNPFMYALVGAAYSVFQLIGSPVLGFSSLDRPNGLLGRIGRLLRGRIGALLVRVGRTRLLGRSG